MRVFSFERSGTPAPWWAVGVVWLVAIWDLSTGLWLLSSAEPWAAHGPSTVWLTTPEVLQRVPESSALFASLYRRIGAFSVFAACTGGAVALVGRHRPGVLAAWMLFAIAVGLVFFTTDAAAFPGTRYELSKQLVGTAWAVAFASLVWKRRRAE